MLMITMMSIMQLVIIIIIQSLNNKVKLQNTRVYGIYNLKGWVYFPGILYCRKLSRGSNLHAFRGPQQFMKVLVFSLYLSMKFCYAKFKVKPQKPCPCMTKTQSTGVSKYPNIFVAPTNYAIKPIWASHLHRETFLTSQKYTNNKPFVHLQ